MDAQVFRIKQEIARKILALCQCDAEKIGVGRSTLKFIKDGMKNGKEINLKTSAINRLIQATSKKTAHQIITVSNTRTQKFGDF